MSFMHVGMQVVYVQSADFDITTIKNSEGHNISYNIIASCIIIILVINTR